MITESSLLKQLNFQKILDDIAEYPKDYGFSQTTPRSEIQRAISIINFISLINQKINGGLYSAHQADFKIENIPNLALFNDPAKTPNFILELTRTACYLQAIPDFIKSDQDTVEYYEALFSALKRSENKVYYKKTLSMLISIILQSMAEKQLDSNDPRLMWILEKYHETTDIIISSQNIELLETLITPLSKINANDLLKTLFDSNKLSPIRKKHLFAVLYSFLRRENKLNILAEIIYNNQELQKEYQNLQQIDQHIRTYQKEEINFWQCIENIATLPIYLHMPALVDHFEQIFAILIKRPNPGAILLSAIERITTKSAPENPREVKVFIYFIFNLCQKHNDWIEKQTLSEIIAKFLLKIAPTDIQETEVAKALAAIVITPESVNDNLIENIILNDLKQKYSNPTKTGCFPNKTWELVRAFLSSLLANKVDISRYSRTIDFSTFYWPAQVPIIRNTLNTYETIAVLLLSNNEESSSESSFATYFANLLLGKETSNFIDLIKAKNAINPERYRTNLDLFFIKYSFELAQLKHILGDSFYKFLRSFIKTSATPLERFLNSYKPLPGGIIVLLQKIFARAEKISVASIERLLLLVVGQIELEQDLQEKAGICLKTLTDLSNQQSSLEQKVDLFNDSLFQYYLNSLDIPSKTAIVQPPHDIFQAFLLGRHNMKWSHYCKVFDEFMKVDLGYYTFQNFAENPNQTSEIGQKVAVHNLKIKKQLVLAGIDTARVFNYGKKIFFSYKEPSAIDFNSLADLWQSLMAVASVCEKLLNGQSEKEFLLLANFHKQIQKFKTEVMKKSSCKATEINSENIDVLKRIFNNRATLKKIADTFIRVKENNVVKQSNDSEAQTAFEKFSNFSEDIDKLNKIESSEKLFKKPKRFRVEIWDKKRIDTFRLGDYVNCCLAPNSSDFPGVVQRRMDHAMLMHVIIDEETNTPVALNWLYLAEIGGKVYLVANFFEIKESYAANLELKNILIKHLLYYTATFAKEVNAEGFLIAPLRYGPFKEALLPNFNFTAQKISDIKKVGGPLLLNDEDDDLSDQEKKDLYFLESLRDKAFFSFSVKELEKLFDVVPTFVGDSCPADQLLGNNEQEVRPVQPNDSMLPKGLAVCAKNQGIFKKRINASDETSNKEQQPSGNPQQETTIF